MKNLFFLIFSLNLFFVSCTEPESHLTFKGIKSKTAKHLGEGVWLDVPSFYKKARTYDGFQAQGYESSISLQVNNASLEEVKKSFDKEVLARKKTKLITLQVVPFGDQDSAVFSIVYDKRKQTRRYLLSVARGNKMYGIKAFCFDHLKDKYDMLIKRSLESVTFAETIEKKEAFMLAKLVSLKELIYTRDGEFPTQSEDEATLVIKKIDPKKAGSTSGSKSNFLSNTMKEYADSRESSVRIEKVEDGHFISAYFLDSEKKVFGAHLSDGKELSNLYIGTSTTREGIKELGQYVRDTNIKTAIGLR